MTEPLTEVPKPASLERSGELAEGIGETEVLRVVNRARDHRDRVAGESLLQHWEKITRRTHVVAPGSETLGVGNEIGVGEINLDVRGQARGPSSSRSGHRHRPARSGRSGGCAPGGPSRSLGSS